MARSARGGFVNHGNQFEITCRQVWRELSNYLEGEVSPELRVRIRQHLAKCSHCRAVMDGVRNTVTIIADERALELPKEVSMRLYSKLSRFLGEKN